MFWKNIYCIYNAELLEILSIVHIIFWLSSTRNKWYSWPNLFPRIRLPSEWTNPSYSYVFPDSCCHIQIECVSMGLGAMYFYSKGIGKRHGGRWKESRVCTEGGWILYYVILFLKSVGIHQCQSAVVDNILLMTDKWVVIFMLSSKT